MCFILLTLSYVQLSKYRRTGTLVPSSSPTRHRTRSTPKKFRLFGDLWDTNENGLHSTFTVEEELKDYCHPANWPDPETVDIVQWWDVSDLLYFSLLY